MSEFQNPAEDERLDIHNSSIPKVCLACEARHKGVCGALTAEQLTRMNERTTRKTVRRGQVLKAAEMESNSYANILSGVVKLSKLMSDGRQQIVGLQFAPDFMGRPYSRENDVTIETATEVQLCSFPKSVLEAMLKEAPDMERRLHEQALVELDEARNWLLALGRKTAAEKVASFIVLITLHIDPENDSESDQRQVELPMTRSDIADFLGLTTETVSRQLTNLRKQGIIDIVDRRHVSIPSLAALSNASGDLIST